VVDPISGADLAAVEALLEAGFAGRVQVRLGEVVDVLALPGLVSRADGQVTGYVAYRVGDGEAEIAALVVAAGERHAGTGTALVEAVARVAGDAGARRLRLVTTNDNGCGSTSAAASGSPSCTSARWTRPGGSSPPSPRSGTTASRSATSSCSSGP